MRPSTDPSRPRPRGRPRRDSGAPAVTRESITAAALGIAAENGFPALTMRALAERLGVTVRALYNHVSDRQHVIDLVAERMMELQPEHRLDPEDWQDSIRTLYREARGAFRSMGRAVLFALDETVTPVEVHPNRVLQPERLLAFLTTLGLDLEDALAWRSRFLIDVFGYSLLIDHRYDRADEDARGAMQDPVPRPWLDAHPEIDAPLSRRAASLPRAGADDLFEGIIERAILDLDHRRRGGGSR